MFHYSSFVKFIYWARDRMAPGLFPTLHQYCHGDVLDVGGASFFLSARDRGIPFQSWTTLEYSDEGKPQIEDSRFNFTVGDGCEMDFKDDSFDTTLNLQVLEHTFEPIAMLKECVRVTRSGGAIILLLPQTGPIHLAPFFFQNLSRFWIEEFVRRTPSVKVECLTPQGGWWRSIASRHFHFFMTALGRKGNVNPGGHRKPLFYALLPLMVAYATLSIPLCMFLGLGDLDEDPNNHLVVLRKQ
jgi:SAM-dependent methyltransferase